MNIEFHCITDRVLYGSCSKAALHWLTTEQLEMREDVKVVVALNPKKHEIIGFIRFRVDTDCVEDKGVWVKKKHRRQGLGEELWRQMLRRVPAKKRILVSVITEAGAYLVEKVQRKYSNRTWDVYYFA